jgi:hypothetical protein
MFGFGPVTRIYLAVGATDMRKSFEGSIRAKLAYVGPVNF